MTNVPASLTNSLGGDRSAYQSTTLSVTDVTADAAAVNAFDAHEQVLAIRDPASGLDGYIALHNTTLGPALGGCRAVSYGTADDALTDVLRLSRAMTYKAALTGLPLGGGKSVIRLTDGTVKSEKLFHSFGRAVQYLVGQYIAAEDSGTTVEIMDWISLETDYVIGTSRRGGDPSQMTADGVMAGLKATVQHRLGTDDITGMHVAVQGLGHVGFALCKQLAEAGVVLTVADIDQRRVDAAVETFGASVADPTDIHRCDAEVFAPCALGAILNDQTISELRCAVVAGSANNQLANDGNGRDLHRRGILYAPDYVINAGGLISAGVGWFGDDPNGPRARAQTRDIGETLSSIFSRSHRENLPPSMIADRLAEERLQASQSPFEFTERARA